jgi:hypothetical protein
MSNLRSYAKIVFATTNGNLNIDSSNSADSLILGVTTVKQLASSVGQFSIDLSPRILKEQYSTNVLKLGDSNGNTSIDVKSLSTNSIPDIIKPYTLVQISFKTDESGFKVEMIGYVSRASIQTKVDQKTGKPIRVFHIDGFDLTRALQDYKLYYNPFIITANGAIQNGLVALASETANSSTFLTAKNAAEFISTLLAFAFGKIAFSNPNAKDSPYYGFYFNPVFNNGNTSSVTNVSQLVVTGGLSLRSLIDFSSGITTVFTESKMSDPTVLINMNSGDQMSLWDLIKMYSDAPFHECFIDLVRPYYPYTTSVNEYSQSGIETISKSEEEAEKIQNSFLSNVSPNQNPSSSSNRDTPVVFHMRTTPFSETAWYNLSYHYFSQGDILSSNLATSEENIFNYYQISCERESVLSTTEQLAFASATTSSGGVPLFPIFDIQSILTYGIRKFPADTTRYVDFINQVDGKAADPLNSATVLQETVTLNREMFRYYAYGEDFETGTVQLKGRVGQGENGAMIGSRFIEKGPDGSDTGKQYYIESVSQSFSVGSPLLTSLTLTRGHFPSNRFSKLRVLENQLGLQDTLPAVSSSFYNTGFWAS